jgi:outer membrane protein assembly factor BamB
MSAMPSRTLACLLVPLLAGCGSRTALSLESSSPGEDSGTSTDAGGRPDADAMASPDADAMVTPAGDAAVCEVDASGPDLCPSALLAGAPRAMLANCSTRDGRSRVVGPTSPHVTWSTQVIPPPVGESSFMELAADASEGVYLVVGDDDDDFGSFVRLDASSGLVDWTTPFDPLPNAYAAPLLLADGLVEFFAADSKDHGVALDSFAPMTGAATSLGLPALSPVYSGDAAVGMDGSLYVAYPIQSATGMPEPVVSRLTPTGVVTWTSQALASLLPPATVKLAFVTPGTLALGPGDLVLVPLAVQAPSSPPTAYLVALDPASGAVAWTRPVMGPIIGGPAVTPNGSIVVLVGPPLFTSAGPEPTSLFFYDPSGAQELEVGLGTWTAAALFAVAHDGSVVLGVQSGPATGIGYDQLYVIHECANYNWTVGTKGLMTATLDAHGTVLAATSVSLLGLDVASGKLLWSVPAQHAGASILDATFTSSGGIVAVETDGSAFGASD